jgi:hypothetical protein
VVLCGVLGVVGCGCVWLCVAVCGAVWCGAAWLGVVGCGWVWCSVVGFGEGCDYGFDLLVLRCIWF